MKVVAPWIAPCSALRLAAVGSVTLALAVLAGCGDQQSGSQDAPVDTTPIGTPLPNGAGSQASTEVRPHSFASRSSVAGVSAKEPAAARAAEAQSPSAQGPRPLRDAVVLALTTGRSVAWTDG